MKLLFDTSVLIDHLRGDPAAVELLLAANRQRDELWGCVLTRTEILRRMRTAERLRTFQLLDSIAWQDVTVEIADRAGELARARRKSHPGVDVVDFTIAAAAESLGARLLTRNVKHFPMIPDLKPAYS